MVPDRSRMTLREAAVLLEMFQRLTSGSLRLQSGTGSADAGSAYARHRRAGRRPILPIGTKARWPLAGVFRELRRSDRGCGADLAAMLGVGIYEAGRQTCEWKTAEVQIFSDYRSASRRRTMIRQ